MSTSELSMCQGSANLHEGGQESPYASGGSRPIAKMCSPLTLEQQLERLREHTRPPTSQPRRVIDDYSAEHEHSVRQLLSPRNVVTHFVPEEVSAAIKGQITRHRRIRTATSRVVEMDVREVLRSNSLPAVTMRILLEKLHRFFVCVERRCPELIPSGVDTIQLQELYSKGNERQHFHTIRSLLNPFRIVLRYLSDSDQGSRYSLLQQLGKVGVVVPSEVSNFVATAAFGDTDEILSPPEDLRKVWKPVGREREAPEDGGHLGEFTEQLWRTHWRVGDCHSPPVSEYELKALFGANATLESHANERLPYQCGANKYTLAGQDPFVVDCTNKGFFTTSGPSGTAYRYLNLWLVLGGSRKKLPELRFAMAALILGGVHHSLFEVIGVCAPLLGHEMPKNLDEMLEQLIPRTLELVWRGKAHSITPGAFRSELSHRIGDRLA